MSICGSVCRYQGSGGISRGYLVVRHGALNSAWRVGREEGEAGGRIGG